MKVFKTCKKCGLPIVPIKDVIPLLKGLCWYCRRGIAPAPKKGEK